MSDGTPQLTVLDNGLTVVTRYAERAAVTDIFVKVLAGSRDEIPDVDPRGTAHFDEHGVCTGSSKVQGRARDLIESVPGFDEDAGHYFTPATQFYFTNYVASVPVASTHFVLGVIGDSLVHPLFRERDIEVERRRILNESIGCQLGYDSRNFENWIVPHVAYGQDRTLFPVIGDKRGIQEISVDHLKRFHTRNVTAGRTVLAVEGAVDHDEIVAAAREKFMLPPGLRSPSETPVYTGGDSRYWLPGDGGTHIALAFKAPPEGDSKAGIAFKVLAKLLTAKTGKHSILQALGSDELCGYHYAVSTWQNEDAGLLTISFKTMEVAPFLKAIQKILVDLTEHVDPEALAQVRAQQERHIETSKKLFKMGASNMAGDVFLHGKVMPPDHYSRLRLAVTEDQVKGAVREMLSHPPTFVAAGDLGPLPTREEVRNLFHYKKTVGNGQNMAVAPEIAARELAVA